MDIGMIGSGVDSQKNQSKEDTMEEFISNDHNHHINPYANT